MKPIATEQTGKFANAQKGDTVRIFKDGKERLHPVITDVKDGVIFTNGWGKYDLNGIILTSAENYYIEEVVKAGAK